MTRNAWPLHRLTPLHDDPAATWLTPAQRLRVSVTGVIGWVLYLILLRAVYVTLNVLMARTIAFGSWIHCAVATIMLGVVLFWPVKRLILRRTSAKIRQLVRTTTPSLGVQIDDFTELDNQPDGTVVSLVGWIKARGQLGQTVGGEPCIGLAMACVQKYPGVLETLNDFELVDETDHTVLVMVAAGRMLGTSNVNLTEANERRLIVASLDLPVSAVATGWDAFVLRDGDPVMVVGFKQSAPDPTQTSMRAPPIRATVGSMTPRPLLVFPLAAERRAAPATMLNLS